MNYVTADLHLSHGNIIKYCHRPFLAQADKDALEAMGGVWHRGAWKAPESKNYRISHEAVQMMNDTIIGNINRYVRKNDTLWILGDFAYGIRDHYFHTCERLRAQIDCRHVNLIWGNHDKKEIRELFDYVGELVTLNFNGSMVTMCHYAMALWNQSHRGSIQIYGHSHSNAEDWLDDIMPGRRSMDVGVDNAYKLYGEFRPLCIETEVIPRMLSRPGHGNKRNPQMPEEP